jgi:hypothetical protein
MTAVPDRHWHRPWVVVLALAPASLLLLMLARPVDGIAARQPGPEHSSTQNEVALVTRPVGQGIEEILADAVGHRLRGGRVREVEVADDGRVWVAVGGRVIMLGQPGAVWPRSGSWRALPRRLSDSPQGDLWAVEDGGRVVALEGEVWTDRSAGVGTPAGSIGVTADGSVWRIGRSGDGPASVLSLVDDTWRTWPSDGLDAMLGHGQARYTLASTTDGRVWLGVDGGAHAGGLAYLDGDVWRSAGSPIADGPLQVLAMVTGRQGDLWAIADVNPRTRTRPGSYVLLRHLDDTWTSYGPEQGMIQDRARGWTGWSPVSPAAMVIDDAGRVWLSVEGTGLVVFDGSVFQRVVAPGLGRALDLDVAPDGSVWVVGARGGLYRVDATAFSSAVPSA